MKTLFFLRIPFVLFFFAITVWLLYLALRGGAKKDLWL